MYPVSSFSVIDIHNLPIITDHKSFFVYGESIFSPAHKSADEKSTHKGDRVTQPIPNFVPQDILEIKLQDNSTVNCIGMEVVLTPVEESEEDISFEAATESELRGLESQYHKENCVMSASAMSTQQISEKNSLDKYKCSISNCETCRKQSHTILSKEINSHLLDPKKYVVQSQSIDKSDPQSVTRSKSNSKQEDLVIQKSKGKVKNTMGSASSVSKNKKQAKPRTKQDVLKNSDLRAQSRLQKGQEYEAKTSKTLKRIEAKYKATGSASFSSLQGQNTPVIEDVYPAKEDNADQLLKKVKVTTTNLPYHIRSRSAPSKKRTPAKQQDLPKSSRVNKGIKKSADAEETSKTPRKLIENTETEQQNEELGDEKGKACDTDRAQLSSKDIVPDIGIECVIEELNSEFNNGVDDLRYALHGIKHGLPYIQQPALNEGVEEIILIDPPPEFGSLSNNMENHESITSKRSDYDPGERRFYALFLSDPFLCMLWRLPRFILSQKLETAAQIRHFSGKWPFTLSNFISANHI